MCLEMCHLASVYRHVGLIILKISVNISVIRVIRIPLRKIDIFLLTWRYLVNFFLMIISEIQEIE